MMNQILQPYIGQVECEAAAINRATGRVDYLTAIGWTHAHLHSACARALPVPTHFVHKTCAQ